MFIKYEKKIQNKKNKKKHTNNYSNKQQHTNKHKQLYVHTPVNVTIPKIEK